MNDTTKKNRETPSASGRFVLRIDSDLHAALREAARTVGISLNEYCARKLAFPASVLAGAGVEAVTRAALVVGDALLGVVVFGSWARSDMGEKSRTWTCLSSWREAGRSPPAASIVVAATDSPIGWE